MIVILWVVFLACVRCWEASVLVNRGPMEEDVISVLQDSITSLILDVQVTTFIFTWHCIKIKQNPFLFETHQKKIRCMSQFSF